MLPSIWHNRENHAISIELEDTKNKYNVQFSNIFDKGNNKSLDKFIATFKKDISQALGVTTEQVFVYGIQNDQIRIVFDIIDPNTQ